MNLFFSARGRFALAIVVALAAVGAALVTQHVFDMQPCPWCVFQRLEFVTIALLALPGLLWSRRLAQQAAAGGVLVLALCGVATALWQHFVAASNTSCRTTLADEIVRGLGLDELLPRVFGAYASCAEAAVKLFGVWYEFYSLALFVGLAILALSILRRT